MRIIGGGLRTLELEETGGGRAVVEDRLGLDCGATGIVRHGATCARPLIGRLNKIPKALIIKPPNPNQTARVWLSPPLAPPFRVVVLNCFLIW